MNIPSKADGAALRLVAVGDIGSTTTFHVGDESMMRGLIDDVAATGTVAKWTLLSPRPQQSAELFRVPAVAGLDFRDCDTPSEREARLSQLDRVLAEPVDDWNTRAPEPWRAALIAIAASDAVIIAGGGNLSRSWPEHVFERVAVARAAHRAGKRVIVTGQTLGPFFDPRTRQLVAELLAGSSFVGLREEHSLRLAADLGAPPDRTVLQFDDAIALEGAPSPHALRLVGDGPFIAVSLNRLVPVPDATGFVSRLAEQLASLSRATSAAVVLVPHVGDRDGCAVEDVLFAAAIVEAAGLGSGVHAVPLPSIAEAVWYCQRAAVVISARYHPIVYAIGASTPALFLHQDYYTQVKGQGALALAGLEPWTMAVSVAVGGLLMPAALDLWTQRNAIARHLRELRPVITESRRVHRESVLHAIRSSAPAPPVNAIPRRRGPLPAGDWPDRAHGGWSATAAELERAALTARLKQNDVDLRLIDARAATAERWAGALAAELQHRDAAALTRGIAETTVQRPAAGPWVACTIVARNYLPNARVLARSLAAVHSAARLTVLVIDGDADPSDHDRFRVLGLDDVLPDAIEHRHFTLMYDVTELSTAIKPWLLKYLLGERAGAVLYFDPDIQIFESVDGLAQLAAQHGIALTPHVLQPIPDDGHGVSDVAVLCAGTFNLGFIGVGRSAAPFLDWWAGRLKRHCVSDPANGLFVDQRWVDLVPGLFAHAVVKDPGCNVAYWNLHERALERDDTSVTVSGGPLRFFHFSGFDPDAPALLSRYQGASPRVLLSEQPVLRDVCDAYALAVRHEGYSQTRPPYGHGALPDGTPIDISMRRLYRRELLQAERDGVPVPPAPFGIAHILKWFQSPAPEAPRLSRYLFGLYEQRPDLQRAFPSTHGADVDAYLNWVEWDPWARQTIPAVFRPASKPTVPAPQGHGFAYGLNVVGYFKAELGVGEIARLITSAATGDGIPVSTVLNSRTISRQSESFAVGSDGGPYSVTLVCANADETPRTIDALPRTMVDGCHRIGFWFWETETLPRAYASAADGLDEIWVASDYVAAAVRATVSTPVYVCPVPVRTPHRNGATRQQFGLPDRFLFLFAFDFLSTVHRKNPLGAIEAYRRAFSPEDGAMLVLKSINGERARGALESVRDAIHDRQDIALMDTYLDAHDRDGLTALCDSYVSLHRSEGFGLTLAEAMALGKPTIATGYSGNLAFMTPANSFLVPWQPMRIPVGWDPYPRDHGWAAPDIDAAAATMRLVFQNPDVAAERGRAGRQHVLEHLSPSRTAAFVRGRLDAIAATRRPVAPIEIARAAPEIPPPPVPGLAPRPGVAETPAAAAAPMVSAEELARLAETLDAAARGVKEADRMRAEGIPFRTPSRFGWPGQVARAIVLRLIRPYTQLEVRTQQRQAESTLRLVDYLRRLNEANRADRPDVSLEDDVP